MSSCHHVTRPNEILVHWSYFPSLTIYHMWLATYWGAQCHTTMCLIKKYEINQNFHQNYDFVYPHWLFSIDALEWIVLCHVVGFKFLEEFKFKYFIFFINYWWHKIQTCELRVHLENPKFVLLQIWHNNLYCGSTWLAKN